MQLDPGGVYRPETAGTLHADAEVALQVGPDLTVAGFGAALELVDLAGMDDDAESIVAANIFHRAFALGPVDRPLPAGGVEGRLIVNGKVRASGPSSRDFEETVRSVGAILAAVGETLRVGDVLITGSVVQVPVAPGDEVAADLGPLGRAQLTVGGVYRASTANHPAL